LEFVVIEPSTLRLAIRQALLPAVGVSLMFSAHAQQSAPTNDETVLPKIKVEDTADDSYKSDTTQIGKVPQSLRDIPQSLTVVSRATIDAQAAVKLTDALRNVPGVTISAGEGGQIGDNINLRGFSARTDLFIDGFRDRGQYSRDTFFLNAVEVLKGPSSILFGRGSTGGVINQVSKRPTGRDSVEVAASVGTESYYRATIDVNGKLSDNNAFRIAALGYKADSTRDVVESERYGINPSLRVGAGTDVEITLSALLQRNREIPDYGFPLIRFQGQRQARPVDVPADRFYGFRDDRFDQDVNNLNISLQLRLSETVTLTNLAQYTDYKTLAAPTPLGGLVNPTTGAAIAQPLPVGTPVSSLFSLRQQRDRELDDSSIYNQTNLTWVIPGAITHTIVAGAEIGRDEFLSNVFMRTNLNATPSSVSPLPAVSLGNPDHALKPPLSATLLRVPTQRTDAAADSFAAFANDQIDLGSQWKLVLGVRWDDFKVQQQQINSMYTFPVTNPAAPARNITETKLQHTDVFWSERAGLIWQPDNKQSYYLSYGTSFNPSGETLTLNTNNASLDPEENRSFELGAKLGLLDDRLLLTSSVFRVEKTNARTTDLSGGTAQILDGVTRVDGFELGAIGRITDTWQLTAGYSFLDGEIVDSNDTTNFAVTPTAMVAIPAEGKRPQNTPRHSVTFWSSYRFLGAFEAGGGAVYSSKRFVNNFETAAIDSYARADLAVAYVQADYSVRLNVLNLTDKKYFETASGGRATPVQGRQFVLSGAYKF
jgi:catecholate siderophore receptor